MNGMEEWKNEARTKNRRRNIRIDKKMNKGNFNIMRQKRQNKNWYVGWERKRD